MYLTDNALPNLSDHAVGDSSSALAASAAPPMLPLPSAVTLGK